VDAGIAVAATAAMSIGAVARATGLSPLIAFAAYAVALLALLVASLRRGATRPMMSPRNARLVIMAAALVLLGYAVAGGALIATTSYHSDAVVAAHGSARLLLEGRHPYADFDLVRELGRFGLTDTYATPLDDGSRVRSLQYPALAFLVPAPLIALGLGDLRVLYLAEILAIFALVLLGAPPRWRPAALFCCVANAAILLQFVDAGVDPLWALLVLAAWLLRRRRASAVLLGLALAARQPAWLIAPFLVVWAWQRFGVREALARAGIAALVAIAIHLPFVIGAPLAVVRGITDPALLPLEAWGIGPAKLAADGFAPLSPRVAYLAAAAIAYVAALWAFASRRARGALVLPLFPLWLAWRALESYFAFLPLFLLAGERDD